MRYQSKSKNSRRIGILYALAGVAVILAIFALVRTASSLDLFKKDDGTTVPGGSSPTSHGGDGTSASQDTTVPPTAADLDNRRAKLLDECELLVKGYFYDEAVEKLQGCGELENPATQSMLAEVKSLKAALVPYTDEQLYHVFYHSLIIDTSKAFDGDAMESGYNMYMTTVSEFEKMLPLFLQNNFILYDITQLVEFKDGKAMRKEILLPPGKKPLVISIDDVNYYDYMKPDGFADRLDVDKDGNVVTVVLDENGKDTITYDGDVMPILDAFVKEHPEFSWRGHKGIVAVTGYQGAFGYRITDLEDYDDAKQKWMLAKVEEVAAALRNSGWLIASHSYTHNQYWNNKTMTMEQLKYDTGRWLGEIMPYVGGTDILISPFGVSFSQTDERFRYIVDNGFQIYCPVSSLMHTSWQNDNFIMERLNLDGITMLKNPERVKKFFFDPALVLDPARPALK